MVNADVMVIGAGAAGLMCASEADKRDRKVLLLDHARKLAEKFGFLAMAAVISLIFKPHLKPFYRQIRISVNPRFVNMTSMISSR